jgi:hypothetical protein
MTTTTARKGGTPDAETWGRLVEMLMADPGDRHHRRAQLASAVELIGAAMAMAGREPDWIEKRVAEFADRFAKAAEGESIQVAADWVHKMAGGRELRDDSGPGLCEDGRSVMWYVQFGDDEWMGVCADSTPMPGGFASSTLSWAAICARNWSCRPPARRGGHSEQPTRAI